MKRAWGWVAWVALGGALLACTLSFSDDPTPVPTLEQAGGGPLPQVQIIAPQNGQQVNLGTDVEIQVAASDAQGVLRLQLNVGNRTSSTKAFPEPASQAEAILRWRPDREGTFELSVIAFRNRAVFSEPVTITLQVLGRTASITNPASGQGEAAPVVGGDCVGRVLIGNLRIRSGPGTGFSTPGNFDLNETVTVIGRNADDTWVQIRRVDGSQNWMIRNPEWIELSGRCDNLPVSG